MVHKLLLVLLGFEVCVCVCLCVLQGGSQKLDTMSLEPDKVCLCVLQGGSQKFDPMSLEPDKVCLCVLQGGSQKFDPMSLEPDKVTLELEIGPSVVLLFGTWLRKFMHLKVGVL